MSKNFKEFKSIFNAPIAVWETDYRTVAIRLGDDPDRVIDIPTAHALIRHLIEIAGQPPEAPKPTYADLEPGTRFQFDIGDPDNQPTTPVYLKINDEFLWAIQIKVKYPAHRDLTREVVVVDD